MLIKCDVCKDRLGFPRKWNDYSMRICLHPRAKEKGIKNICIECCKNCSHSKQSKKIIYGYALECTYMNEENRYEKNDKS